MNHLTGSIVYYQLVESLLDDADVAVWLFCKQLWHEVLGNNQGRLRLITPISTSNFGL